MVKSEEKQQHCFRILIIGRANAGKTTLLRHISGADSSEEPVYQKGRSLKKPSVKPTEDINPTDERGIHDVNQSFYFPSNPRFIFHDSPGFETGDETQLEQVQNFIKSRSKKWKMDEQLHAIWFCLLTNASRPFLEPERRFFDEERPGKVPVIAIFMKFDDLITQVYDPELGPQENRQAAEQVLDTKFRKPISNFAFPPVACLTMEDMHKNSPLCRNQIKILIEETAKSLDGSTLKLFVSTQRTNLELCSFNAVSSVYYSQSYKDVFLYILTWFPHTPVELRRLDYSLRFSGRMSRIKAKVKIRFHSNWLNHSHPLRGWLGFQKSFGEEFRDGSQYLNIIARIALIICAENSFWRCSLGVQYFEALEQSFQEYKISESRRFIEAAILDLGPSRSPLDGFLKKSELVVIALNNRLPRPGGLNDEQEWMNDEQEWMNDEQEWMNDEQESMNDEQESMNDEQESMNDKQESMVSDSFAILNWQ